MLNIKIDIENFVNISMYLSFIVFESLLLLMNFNDSYRFDHFI